MGTRDLAALIDAIAAGERVAIARAITLVESSQAGHRADAEALLKALAPHAGKAIRIGITGVPGVGKSTFIDAFGTQLTAAGHKVAVLAVDPSSQLTGGSILGDKTRMARLAVDANAYIRPSPAGKTLGGVARATREAMSVVEAAGYDIVLVETVGVGQSETAVADMVDVFLALMLPGAGDDLQGIKKGLLELAHIIAVNKADGDNLARAREAASAYRLALSITHSADAESAAPVVTCSATTGEGLDEIWRLIETRVARARADGHFEARRASQRVKWMWSLFDAGIREALDTTPRLASLAGELEQEVRAGAVPASAAARQLIGALGLECEDAP